MSKKNKRKALSGGKLIWKVADEWTSEMPNIELGEPITFSATMTVDPGPVLTIEIKGNTITIDYTP